MSYDPEANCANCGQYRRQHNGREEWCNTQEPMHFLEETEPKGGSMSEQKETRLFCDLSTNEEKADFIASGRAWETGIIAAACQEEFAGAYRKLALFDQETARLRARVAELEETAKQAADLITEAFNERLTYSELMQEASVASGILQLALSTPNQGGREMSDPIKETCPECGVELTDETRGYSKFSDVITVGKPGRYYDVCINFCEECGCELSSWLE